MKRDVPPSDIGSDTYPSVSIVTIAKDNLAGLQRTLASVTTQLHRPYECIVVDGASTDGTVEWLAQQHFPDFVRATSEPDDGIYDAMNKGVARASGDYILMLNSGDCLADRSVLSDVVARLATSSSDWVFGKSIIETAEGDYVHDLKYLRRFRLLMGLMTVPHQAVLMSTGLLRTLGGFRTDVGISADQELLSRAWRISTPTYLDMVVARCEGGGRGSTQEVGAYARSAAKHRELQGATIAGSRLMDQVVTSLGITFAAGTALLRHILRLVRAVTRGRPIPDPREPSSHGSRR
ncbi:glycosyltransferase [Mycobacterium sp. Y57]|nr:glycosyltransferase [Mycolicibacterium xanthum]